jgi:hypothetical protein
LCGFTVWVLGCLLAPRLRLGRQAPKNKINKAKLWSPIAKFISAVKGHLLLCSTLTQYGYIRIKSSSSSSGNWESF